MICNNCTARISDKSIVCPVCGAPVKNAQRSPGGEYPKRNTERYAAYPGNGQPMQRGYQEGQRPAAQKPYPMEQQRPYPSQRPQKPYQAMQQVTQQTPQRAYSQIDEYPFMASAQQPKMSQPPQVPIQQPVQTQAPVQSGQSQFGQLQMGNYRPQAAQPQQEVKAAVNPVNPFFMGERNSEIPEDYDKAYSVGGFIGTFIVGAIPLVGLICYLVWAFSKKTNLSKRNYCRAVLLLALIFVLLLVIAVVVLMALDVDLMKYITDLQEMFYIS